MNQFKLGVLGLVSLTLISACAGMHVDHAPKVTLSPKVEADLNKILGEIGEICRTSDLCIPDVDPVVNFPPTVPPVALNKVFTQLRDLNARNRASPARPK